jgi:hypothetical protein
VFRRNEGNGTVGGPIKKNKIFFFGSVDVLRSGLGQGFSASAITPELTNYIEQNYPQNISANLVKNFPSQLTKLSDGLTAGQVASSPCSGSTPITTPIGTLPCNFPMTFNGSFAQTLPRNGLQWFGRIDNSFRDGKDRLYGSIGRTTLDTVRFGSPDVYPAFTALASEYTMYWNVNETHIFSSNVLNEAAWSGTRAWGDAPVSHGEVPEIDVTGIASYGTGFSDAIFIQNNQNWRDVLTINRGSHSFKTGGTFQCGSGCPGAGALFHNTYTRVHYFFPTLFDFVKDDPLQESNIGFDPKTGKQLGPDFRPVYENFGIFFQDDWKVKRNLTLSLGVRWEVYLNPSEKNNLYVGATFPKGNDYWSRITDLTPVVKRPLDHTDLNNFAPRLGIAWDPTGKGNTSIRAGAGVFYDRASGQFFYDAGTSLPVVGLAVADKRSGIQPVYGLSTSSQSPWLFPAPPINVGLDEHNGLVGIPSAIDVWDPSLRTMYTYNYFFGIQHQFAANLAVEANYVGSVGHKTYMGYDVNRYAGDLLDGSLDRINHSFAGIQYGQARGSSFYNGANVSVKKRFSSGLNFQVAYTFGKAIDDSSSFGLGLNIEDANNLKLSRGLSDFDVRQKLALSLLYETPLIGQSSVAKVFSRWQLGVITILQSGQPFAVYCGSCDYNLDGFYYDYPNAPSFGGYKGGFSRQQYLSGIFPASAFGTPVPGQDGTLGRNMYFGPHFYNTNLNVVKPFRLPFLGEQGTLDFRVEFFNLFNTTNLSGMVGDVSSGQFGQATTALGARNVQFGLRLAF